MTELVGTPYAVFVGAATDRLAAVPEEILDGTSRVVQVEHEVAVGGGRRQVLATIASEL